MIGVCVRGFLFFLGLSFVGFLYLGIAEWNFDPDVDCLTLLGSVSDTKVIIWVRAVNASSFSVEFRLLHASSSSSSSSTSFPSHEATNEWLRTDWETLHEIERVGTITIDGLTPHSSYEYRVLFSTQERDDETREKQEHIFTCCEDESSSFQTSPDPGEQQLQQQQEPVHFVWGSCLGVGPIFPLNEFPAIQYIQQKVKPDFLLLLGDLVYVDVHQNFPFRRHWPVAYRQVLSRMEVRTLLHNIPSFVMFDDHEIQNDVEKGLHNPYTPLSLLYYWLYMGSRNPPLLHPPHFFYSFQWGPMISVFVLETRMLRKENVGEHETPSLFGDEQLRLLKEWLLTVSSPFKIIASPVMLSNDDLPISFQQERNSLWNWVEDHKICGVVVLSGDAHLGAAYSYNNGLIHEFSASPFQGFLFPLPNQEERNENDSFVGGDNGSCNEEQIIEETNYIRLFGSGMKYHFGSVVVQQVINSHSEIKEYQLTATIYGTSPFASLFDWNSIPLYSYDIIYSNTCQFK